jgi:protein-S-isoprenylcysteine O-methyltransferase Ste14
MSEILEEAKTPLPKRVSTSWENLFLKEPDIPALHRILTSPVGDKLMAILLVTWSTYLSVITVMKGLGLPLTMLYVAAIILNVQILIRRTPKRVSLNPWFWLLTLAASTNFLLYPVFLIEKAPSFTPYWLNNMIAISGMALLLWARAYMGLNFGFVPALRQIVTGGPFRYVRHPVNASLILLVVGRTLSHASTISFVLGAMGIGLWMLKCLAEEAFLRNDEGYRRYMERVRWRIIPYVF